MVTVNAVFEVLNKLEKAGNISVKDGVCWYTFTTNNNQVLLSSHIAEQFDISESQATLYVDSWALVMFGK